MNWRGVALSRFQAPGAWMRLLMLLYGVLPFVLSAEPEPIGLCRLVNESSRFAGKVVEVQGYIRPLMHGTYLSEDGCDQSILVVLPSEIPHYKGAVKVRKDAEMKAFEMARSNYLPDAPRYAAVFVGELEYGKRGKRFGYYKNLRVRLVLRSVQKLESR